MSYDDRKPEELGPNPGKDIEDIFWTEPAAEKKPSKRRVTLHSHLITIAIFVGVALIILAFVLEPQIAAAILVGALCLSFLVFIYAIIQDSIAEHLKRR